MITGFVSDIHEDIKSLEKAFRILDKLNCDEVICLGDISGYSSPYLRYENKRDASGCLRIVKENCSVIIPGNHDLYACRKIPENNHGFEYPADWYDLDFAERKSLAGNSIWLYENEEETNYTDEDKEFIKGLPEMVIKENDRFRILLSHHLYPDLTGSSMRLLPDRNLELSHLEFMKENDCRLSFFGHNHVEGIWVISQDKSRITKNTKVPDNIIAVSLPCISRGTNLPGLSWFDSSGNMISSQNLEPKIKRFKIM